MSATTAIAISSSITAQQVSAAKDAACSATLAAGSPSGASVEHMQTFAECVQRLHPDALLPAEVIAIKVLIGSVFVGAALGAYRCTRSRYSDWVDGCIGAVLGSCLLPLALVILAIGCKAVAFLFTA